MFLEDYFDESTDYIQNSFVDSYSTNQNFGAVGFFKCLFLASCALPVKDHKCYSMFDLNSRPD